MSLRMEQEASDSDDPEPRFSRGFQQALIAGNEVPLKGPAKTPNVSGSELQSIRAAKLIPLQHGFSNLA